MMASSADSDTAARSSQTLRWLNCASSTALRTGKISPRRPSNLLTRSSRSALLRVKRRPSSVVSGSMSTTRSVGCRLWMKLSSALRSGMVIVGCLSMW